jgi:hypothetical protein
MSTGSSAILPLISGRTETWSAGPISPAAVIEKLMSRVSTRAVETGLASGDSARLRCHCFHTKNPPTLKLTTTSSVKKILINWVPREGKDSLQWTIGKRPPIQNM